VQNGEFILAVQTTVDGCVISHCCA
jgi:hypothetical protein